MTLFRTIYGIGTSSLIWAGMVAAASSAPLLAQELPAGPGKAQLTSVCTVCHGLDKITSQKLSPADWKQTVDKMAARGASASAEDFDVIVTYLSKNFGIAEAAPKVTAALAAPAVMPEGAGKQVILKVCTACHLPDHFTKYRKSPEDWTLTVNRMAARAQTASPEEIKVITDYLIANYPKTEESNKVNINKSNAKQIESLGFSPEEAAAIIQYHKEHGDFRVWGEMLVIYGVDGFKVESLKDKMAF